MPFLSQMTHKAVQSGNGAPFTQRSLLVTLLHPSFLHEPTKGLDDHVGRSNRRILRTKPRHILVLLRAEFLREPRQEYEDVASRCSDGAATPLEGVPVEHPRVGPDGVTD